MSGRLRISKRLLAVNSASSLLSWILKTLLLFWLQRYLLERVTLEEYSLYPVIASVLVFVELLRELLAGGIGRFVVEADVRGEEQKITQITSTMFLVQALSALAVLLLGTVLVGYIDRILEVDPRYVWDARFMLGLMILSFSLHLSTTSLEVGLFARQRFVTLNGLELGAVVLRILLIVLLFSLFGVRVLWIPVAAVTANTLNHLARILLSRRLIPALRFRWKAIQWARARELLSFSSWNFLSSVSYRIYTSLDTLILNKLATPFDVTTFYIGSLFQRQIGKVLQQLTAPLMPSLIGLHALNEHDRLRNTYYRYGRYYIWANMAFVLPVLFFRKELIRLYIGQEYLVAATVMLLLFCSPLLSLGHSALYKMAIALGRIRTLTIGSLIIQSVNVGLTLYFVGVLKLGAVGSALASAAVTFTLQPSFELAIAYLLYFRLIADIGATGALTVTYLIPVFGVLWGALFLGETISALMLGGAALVIAGTVLVLRN